MPDVSNTSTADLERPLLLDPSARYELLASGVCGRRLNVSGGGGERTWTDGRLIHTTDALADGDIRDGIVLQAALIALGSFDPRTMARLAGRRGLRLRYLTLEARRAVDAAGSVLPTRTAARVLAAFDGPAPASRDDSLRQTLGGSDAVPEAPAWMGTIKPGKVIRAAPSVARAAPTDADKAGTSPQTSFPELDDEDEAETSKIMQLFSAPAMRNPLAEYLQKLMGMGSSPDAEADGGAGAEMPVSSRRAELVGPAGEAMDDGVAIDMALALAPAGRLYPEWDCHRARYRADWCSVADYDPPRGDEPPTLGTPDLGLLRALARLGLAHERHRRQDEGDSLDVTALVEFVTERATAGGDGGECRIYETRHRTAHDLGVLVLLDATGSTAESADARRVFDDHRELAARLTAALDELGDRVATYAFQSWGRGGGQFLRVKGFEDRYDRAAQTRLAALEPAGFTRLGAAIRHASFQLREHSGTTNKLLVVLGDGLPYDDGYEHEYAREDSRSALDEAVRDGIGCVCLGVRTSTDEETLARVWGNVPHEVLDDRGTCRGASGRCFERRSRKLPPAAGGSSGREARRPLA